MTTRKEHQEFPLQANHLENLPTISEDGTFAAANGLHTVPTSRARASTTTSTRSNGASSKLYGVRSALGLHAQAPIDEEHDAGAHSELWWPRIRLALREPFAEFCGVFIMIMFGNGSVAQVLLSDQGSVSLGAPGRSGFGAYQSINWCWALGVALGVWIAGDSGGFLNPAVTLANCVYRGLPWRRFPIYLVAQVLGAFVASGVVYANYINAINAYAGHGVRTAPPASTATGQIFCTYPQDFLTKPSMFFSEFIASTLLMFVIYGLKDKSNSGGLRGDADWFPLGLFFLIFGIGAAFGFETGYAINLARDFGPRLMSAILGYSGVWSAGGYYFWIPMVAPFCGCLFGGFLYDLLIYTGPESPINTPYMGLAILFRPDKAIKRRWAERRDEISIDKMNGFLDPMDSKDRLGATV